MQLFTARKNVSQTAFRTLVPIVLVVLLCGTAWAQRMAVSVPMANIRSGPGENYDIIWKVEKYYPIKVTQKQGDWIQFDDFENDRGWIYSSLVDKTEAVITKKDKCNVRSGAGTRFPVVFTVEKGVPFKVLSKNGNWLNVMHADGDKGWIYRSLVW